MADVCHPLPMIHQQWFRTEKATTITWTSDDSVHWIGRSHQFHNAPVPYPTMHHSVTEMCTCVHMCADFCYKMVYCGMICLMHCGICEMGLLKHFAINALILSFAELLLEFIVANLTGLALLLKRFTFTNAFGVNMSQHLACVCYTMELYLWRSCFGSF